MTDETPTLGWIVLAWMGRHLPNPRNESLPYRPVDWQAHRTLRWYELDATGRRLWNRVHDEDPKGKGKSPHGAATCIAEFRGPVVFVGWAQAGDRYVCADNGCDCGWVKPYREGDAMGRPWGTPGLPAPWVQVAAVSEAQTANTWAALHAFLAANDKRVARNLHLDPGRTLVYWLDRMDAKIERVTSSAASRTGQPITHALDDEPQEQTPELRGPELAETILDNTTKMNGWAHFTGNAPVLGRGSVSELLGYRFVDNRWEPVEAPRVLQMRPRPSVMPREDMTRDELRPLVQEVYEGTPWAPVERILDDIEDRAAHSWTKSVRLFLNVPQDDTAATAWMLPDLWDSRKGDVKLDPREPAYSCVRIGHGYQHAALVTAQAQGAGGRRIPLNREGKPVLAPGDRIVTETITYEAAEGEQVSLLAIEADIARLRQRLPARVKAQVPVGNRGKMRDGSLRGPEIAYAGAFFAGSTERLRTTAAALVDIPSTPERLTPAAEVLMQLVTTGVLVHDGNEEVARQLANVVAKPMPKGWKPEPIDIDEPIVAARALMLAVERAYRAPRWQAATVHGL